MCLVSNNFVVIHFYEDAICIELLKSYGKKSIIGRRDGINMIYSMYQYIVSLSLRLISPCMFSVYIYGLVTSCPLKKFHGSRE